jgi:NAD(P)-dependent dehydrogenase (short-subunit alcohol dehydrogenase family)
MERMGFSRSALATRAARGIGRVALGLSIDVTEAESVEAAVAAHIKHFGGLDVMVVNAGIECG